MEELFFENSSSFDDSMQYTNVCLESAIFTYSENLLTNHYVTEAVKTSLWTNLKQFFSKLILAMKDFIKELEIKIEYIINEKQIRDKLKSIHQLLKSKQISGETTIEVIDYWEMKSVFNKYYKDLTKYAKKFSKVKYTKTWQIEDDLAMFDKLFNDCNKELEKISEKKIRVSISKALDFVEDELRGKSELLKSLNDSLRDFAEIEQSADQLRTKMNILGTDVIPRHVGFIQRMVNAVSKFLRKWTVRIIMRVVYTFA